MPTTSNFGWTTPADTDLVKDGAAAIRTLGNGIDTSLIDLKGGTTGQILSKASNTDLDYTWIANDQGDITAVQAGVGISVASGTGPIPVITNSSTDLITTAGDLLYGTAADTVARLGIGTAGQVLKVNSGATAPEWATPASGSTFVGVAARHTDSVQTIANNTYTNMVFSAEYFDTDGFHDNTTNNTRFTVPSGKAGYYLLVCNFEWASNATGERRVRYRLNGSSTLCNYAIAAMSGVGTGFTISFVTSSLSVGDYIEVNVLQTSGGNLDIYSFSDGQRFAMTYLGA